MNDEYQMRGFWTSDATAPPIYAEPQMAAEPCINYESTTTLETNNKTNKDE